MAALASWLRARHAGGAWLLRIDDIDPPRETAGSVRAIVRTLAALGLVADGPAMHESARAGAYAAALQRLRDAGHAFPCWCSRSDIKAARAVHHTLHRDGRCLAAPRRDRSPAWRLRVPDVDITFKDALQGRQSQNVRATVGDFVLQRADGVWSYQLACVVDDAAMGVTEVVRGCDLLESTPRQILLQRMLGLPTPAYLHVPLAVDADGAKLSKSSAAPAVDSDDPVATLSRVLRFLAQPVPAANAAGELLQIAARQCDLAPLRGITARRADLYTERR